MTALRDPVLAAGHGFATPPPELPRPLLRPRQVHGAAVVAAGRLDGAAEPPPADAVYALRGEPAVAVVTADCVPLLLASPDGAAVAAVHAGWRGLAAGVVGAGVAALAAAAERPPGELSAAIGPHIGPCCYEVDAPVLDALELRHRDALHDAVRPGRAGHAQLDLGALAAAALRAAGLAPARIGAAAARCTFCHPQRLASYRRDGPRAGRMVHYVRASARG